MNENKPKEFVVYRIYHIDTGKSYIGITGEYKNRMREHFYYHNINSYLHRAMKKHGKENFKYEIVFECGSWKELCKEEIEYIKIFNTKAPNGYNLTDGGEGVFGLKRSKETRKKMSESAKGKTFSKETRKKMSESGKRIPKEIRKKMGSIQIGRKHSEEHKKKISEAGKGKKHSAETRKNMSKLKLKLSKDQVLEIRKMLLDKIPQRKIAKQFNVTQPTIGRINRNECYVDIQLSVN